MLFMSDSLSRMIPMKKMLFAILAIILLVGCTGEKAAKPEKIRIIFETDMGNDVDDAMALDMLYKYMDAGSVDLLAIMVNKDSKSSAQYIDMLGTWYGYPDVPIGIVRDGVTFEPGSPFLDAVTGLCNEDGSAMFARSHSDYEQLPDAHILYRKILAQQPDNSVVISTVGFSTNLARLLDTPADEYSPLTGKELVARKVKLLVPMAGHMADTTYCEYNVIKDIPAAQKVFAEWPTKMVVSPFEVGLAIEYPGASMREDFGWANPHPLVEAYRAWAGHLDYDRPTWDLTSVLYAVEGDSWFTMSEPGNIVIKDNGASIFTPCEDGRIIYMMVDEAQCKAINERFQEVITSVPASRK